MMLQYEIQPGQWASFHPSPEHRQAIETLLNTAGHVYGYSVRWRDKAIRIKPKPVYEILAPIRTNGEWKEGTPDDRIKQFLDSFSERDEVTITLNGGTWRKVNK